MVLKCFSYHFLQCRNVFILYGLIYLFLFLFSCQWSWIIEHKPLSMKCSAYIFHDKFYGFLFNFFEISWFIIILRALWYSWFSIINTTIFRSLHHYPTFSSALSIVLPLDPYPTKFSVLFIVFQGLFSL